MLVTFLFTSGAAQAALIDRGGGFIYDTVLDITWTQNANMNGTDQWFDQMPWAAGLSIYDSVRDVTWDDWRLPNMDINDDDHIINCRTASELACRDNEYGYMFYQNGVAPGTPGYFTNLQSGPYWSSTAFALNPAFQKWAFTFGCTGVSINCNLVSLQTVKYHAWAVRDGDVIPIPAAAWLFGSALGLLGWLRRRQAA